MHEGYGRGNPASLERATSTVGKGRTIPLLVRPAHASLEVARPDRDQGLSVSVYQMDAYCRRFSAS